jgi:preprotein translocase subunit SecE
MAGELDKKQQNWIESTRAYLGDIRSEMKRVTLVVIVAVFIFAAYFKVVDTVLEKTIVAAETALVK